MAVTYRQVKEPREVVVFFKTQERPGIDEDAYEELDRRMNEIVSAMAGFI